MYVSVEINSLFSFLTVINNWVAASFEILPDDIEETRKNPFIADHLRKQIQTLGIPNTK